MDVAERTCEQGRRRILADEGTAPLVALFGVSQPEFGRPTRHAGRGTGHRFVDETV
jgi:hypothetical protein